MRVLDDATRMALALALIFLTSLASRVMVARNEDGIFDVYGHLYFAKTLSEQRRGPFGDITLQVVGASGFSQPFMWHWLVGFFDQRSIRRYQAWINGVVDSIYAVLSYLLMLQAGYSERVALFAVALYLLTPMWFSSVAIGPRIAGFTPRLSSEVATNLFFAVTLLPIGLPAPAVQLLAVALATFVLSSSKLGVQALLFLTPVVSLLAQRWLPLIVLVLAVVFLIVGSRGRALRQFKAQISHLAWYFRENLQGKMHVSNRNSFRALVKRSESSTRDYVAKLVHRVLSENSYTSVIVKLPVLLVVLHACATSLQQGGNAHASLLAAPVLAAVAVYVLINLRLLLFLGEAERYLNHVAFFIVLFAAQHAAANDSEWVLWVLMAYGLVYWLLESFALNRLKPAQFKDRKVQDALVLQDLRQLPDPTVVLCYPYHAGAGVYRIMSETRHHVVFCFGTSAEFSARFNSKYAADYPYVKLEQLEEMADDYGIGYLVLDRRALQTRGFGHWRPSARWTPRAVSGHIYAVYSRSVDGLR
jgi:hypothetical protein